VPGKDLAEIDKLARQIEGIVKTVPGTSSAYAERVIGGYYLDVVPNREALARYGLMVGDVQDVVSSALGGETITTTVEGRERYGVNLRYPRDLRSDPQSIAREVLVAMPAGGTVPLGEVADIKLTRGPTTIRTENGQLAVYIFVDIRDRDLGGYVADARAAVAANVKFPPGSYAVWSGQFEYLERAKAKLKIVVPLTLLIIFLLLYLNFRRLTETLIVMLSLPFSLVGGLWLMWWLGFNFSVAVAVGFIALAGVAAETGVIMLIYLDSAMKELHAKRLADGTPFTRADLHEAVNARRGGTGTAEDDDGRRHHGRAAADHAEHRRRLRGHAAHRGADDRRDDLFNSPDAGRHPRRLRADQGLGFVAPAGIRTSSGRFMTPRFEMDQLRAAQACCPAASRMSRVISSGCEISER
jgi:Cu(I)/Ag(I) efflux system membrane protein CusA/SilA